MSHYEYNFTIQCASLFISHSLSLFFYLMTDDGITQIGTSQVSKKYTQNIMSTLACGVRKHNHKRSNYHRVSISTQEMVVYTLCLGQKKVNKSMIARSNCNFENDFFLLPLSKPIRILFCCCGFIVKFTLLIICVKCDTSSFWGISRKEVVWPWVFCFWCNIYKQITKWAHTYTHTHGYVRPQWHRQRQRKKQLH